MEILRKTAAFRVQKQTEGLDAAEVRDLSLSGVPFMPELFTPFTGLTHLIVVFMKPKITSILEVPLAGLPHLRSLELSDNAISLEDLQATAGSGVGEGEGEGVVAAPRRLSPHTSLVRLFLANNSIAAVTAVAALAPSLPSLEVLDLCDNPLNTSYATDDGKAHFSSIFGMFPSLVALNSRSKTGEEVVVEDSDETDSDDEYDDGDEEDEEDEEDEDNSGSDGEAATKKPRTE